MGTIPQFLTYVRVAHLVVHLPFRGGNYLEALYVREWGKIAVGFFFSAIWLDFVRSSHIFLCAIPLVRVALPLLLRRLLLVLSPLTWGLERPRSVDGTAANALLIADLFRLLPVVFHPGKMENSATYS